MLLVLPLVALQVRGDAVHVRIVGPNSVFTKITGLNAAADRSYVVLNSGTPIDFVDLANLAASTVGIHVNRLHDSTPRETTGRVRYRPITPANNIVLYAWTGTSTETGIKDALKPILTASGYAVSNHRISSALGWDSTTLDTAKPTFDTYPNQFPFVYGRTSFNKLSGQSVIDCSQANLTSFNFDRHFDSPGSGTPSINNMVLTFDLHQMAVDDATMLVVEVVTTLTTWPEGYAVPSIASSNNPAINVNKDSSAGFDTITLSLARASDHTKFARL